MVTANRTDTKTALMEAAERLLATRGFGGVTAREITKKAKARNTSAVRYHFGSMENLIRAVFQSRILEIDRLRLHQIAEMDAQGLGDDLHMLLDATTRPLLQVCRDEGGRLFALFLAQLTADPRFQLEDLIVHDIPEGMALIRERLNQALSTYPDNIRETRMRRLSIVGVGLVADYARQADANDPASIDADAAEMTRCLAAFLTAPY